MPQCAFCALLDKEAKQTSPFSSVPGFRSGKFSRFPSQRLAPWLAQRAIEAQKKLQNAKARLEL
jgi:hypothetical protein